ncbi:MAG TPA: ABC transporter permease [Vicinamibacterales bacterium]|nr:ABC transporter permease [Vicinamibacterales bacterium]
MSVRGCAAVIGVECSKLAAQLKARVALAACVAGPFAFAAAMKVQSSVPEDTLFGRSVKESGFAVPLVVLGFAAFWLFPVLTSLVGGDLFSAEDRYGTWKTVLTRSRSRSEVFAGKVVTALGFSLLSVSLLALSSVAFGLLLIGSQPLISLSGVLLAPSHALTRVAFAWATVVLPSFGLTAVAVLLSIATRSSVAGVGIPVVAALVMQLYAFVDGPEVIRQALITSAFGAWHGLLAEPPYYGPLVHGSMVSMAYVVICLVIAYRWLQQRDFAG